MHQKLFSQIEIAGRVLKNRVVAAVPFSFLAGNEGEVTDRLALYYERLATTDAGMVITEPARVNQARYFNQQLGGNENESVRGLSRITERIRAYQALPILQLTHPGINACPDRHNGLVKGPSSIELPRITCKVQELGYEEIRQISGNYLEASISAWNAGFSGVEISGADGNLVQQFLSPLTNHRKDDYGYRQNKGIKFVVDIVKAIRKAIPDFLLIFKIATRDLVPGGKTIEDSLSLAQALENAGLDLLHITSGMFFGRKDWEFPGGKTSPDGLFAQDSQIFKRHLRIPIMLSGKVSTPDLAENILARKSSDLISLGRTLNRDLDWLNIAKSNSELIKTRTCLRCLNCSAALNGCPDMCNITLWDLNLNKYLKGKSK
jgi:2,4-dienoyl-CoA reductase-like NADH-dependent reductase (Old Yellow Enzyme family)